MAWDIEHVTFRPARRSECRTIASLYSISSDGVADYVWTRMAEPGEEPLDVGERRYAQEDSVFSYRNCHVATWGGGMVGMLVAFPMLADPADVDTDPDPVLVPYSRLEEHNSYYICGMAVFPQYRGGGIGSRFLSMAEDQAGNRGMNTLSLIVFEQNRGAKRLYERHGYRETAREPVVPHPLIHYQGDALLMVKRLS